MSTVHIVMGGPGGGPSNKPSAVFTDIADVRRYTGKESGTPVEGNKYYWGSYTVFEGVPLNPAPRTGGRKKTARRRRTTRKR